LVLGLSKRGENFPAFTESGEKTFSGLVESREKLSLRPMRLVEKKNIFSALAH